MFGGIVGGTVALEYLTVSGTTAINTTAINTAGIQTYTGAVTLGANTTLTGTTVTFSSTVNGAFTLNIVGDARFDGAVTVTSLTIGGTTYANCTTIDTTGDQTYGGRLALPAGASDEVRQALRNFRRQALHAEKLSFAHPINGETVSVQADPPADFLDLLQVLRGAA